MIFMGIDQSLTGTGLTIYNGEWHYHIIETSKTKDTKSPSIDYTKRLKIITQEILKYIKEYKVTHAAIEGMAFGSRGRVVFDLGGLSHLIRSMLIDQDIKFIVIPPTTLKKYWTGKGNANKEKMIQTTIDKGYNISITKNYGTKKNPNILFDDNVVDSHALCCFLKDTLENNLSIDFIDMIEYSNKD